MIEWRHRIKDAQGLHARPAAMLAVTAVKFKSQITGEYQGILVDVKDAIEILGLNAGQDSEIILKADGCDEEEAFHAIQKVLEQY